MHRIDSVGAVAVQPAPAAAGPNPNGYWQDENIGAGLGGTVADQDWFNAVQEELIAILTAAGIAPAKATRNQVLTAIQDLISQATAKLVIGTADDGAVNAPVLTTSPVITARTYGLLIAFSPAHTNTGACTLNDGLGAVALEHGDSSALQAGDIQAQQPALVWWDGAAYRLTSLSASQATTIAAAQAALAEAAATSALNSFKTGLSVSRIERAYVTGLSGSPTIVGGNTGGTLTRQGVGQYTWTFSTPFPNANYIAGALDSGGSGSGAECIVIVAGSRTVNGFQINCNMVTVGQYDPAELNLTAMN